MLDKLRDYKVRVWLYGIAIALLAILGTAGVINSTESGNYAQLIEAVLLIAPAAALGMGAVNARPSKRDELASDKAEAKHGIYDDDAATRITAE
jgi:hypothetical protein